MSVFYRRSEFGGIERVEESAIEPLLFGSENVIPELIDDDDEPVQRSSYVFKPLGYVKEAKEEKAPYYIPSGTEMPPDLMD